MEEKKSTCREGRKKTAVSISGGGGGIGGVVLWGGALAAATLIGAAFTLIKRNGGRKPANNHQQIMPTTDLCKSLKNNNEHQGLRSILQTSSPSLHFNPCCRSDENSEKDVTQIGSLELVSTQILLLEKKPGLMLETSEEKDSHLCGDEEILPSHYSKSGNIPDIEVKKEDEACETILAEQVEDDLKLPSVQEEGSEEDVDIGGYAGKNCEETSERMVDSSMESITDPVWPTESVENLEMKFHNSGVKINDAPSVEDIEVMKEDEVCAIVHAEQAEEDPPKQSVEDDNEEDVVEKGKESLEGMGNSLIESIAKPIWQTEPIERLKINFQTSREKIEEAPSVEAIEVKKEDETCKTVHVEQIEEDPSMQLIEVEDEDDDDKYVIEKGEDGSKETEVSLMESEKDPPSQSIEEEDGDDEEGDYVIEKSKESSEGIEDSLMKSNTEFVWPTESIEILPLEIKEMKFNSQNSEKKIQEDLSVKKEEDIFNNSRENGNTYDLGNNNKEIARKSTTNSNKITETSELVMNSAKWRIWIWSVLVLVLLFLLLSLTHHQAMSRYLLNDDSFRVV